MLLITLEGDEVFNEETQEFSSVGDIDLHLEHSLVSLSKWESKHEVPFLGPQEKTSEQILDYIICMIQDPLIPEDLFNRMKQNQVNQIQEYINSPQSATTFTKDPYERPSREVITSELIYYWLAAFQISFEVETWHLNRLFALVRIAHIKSNESQKGGQKIPKHDIARRNRELNAQRRAQYDTSG